MLKEFALTPAIFDQDAHKDHDEWVEQLLDLGRGMFPSFANSASIVANLGGGGWQNEAKAAIKGHTPGRSRDVGIALLKKIDKVLVDRELCGDWPSDDIGWGREAFASDSVEPIDRVVTPLLTYEELLDNYPQVRKLREVRDRGFWSDVRATCSPNMVMAEQVALLRKLCVHCEWIALISPYCCTSEQKHCFAVVKANLDAPSRIGPRHIELHTAAKSESGEGARQENLVAGVTRALAGSMLPDRTVEVYFWPRLLERFLIGGVFVPESGGTSRKSPRWGVSMNHVAQETDRPEDRTNWSLLAPEDLAFWFERHVAERAADKPDPHLA